MAQDIRELLKRDQEAAVSEKLPIGHQNRFEARLDQALPKQKSSSAFLWLQIAAVVVVALAAGFFFLYQSPGGTISPIVDVPVKKEVNESTEAENQEEQVTLADISPEFKKVENYYMANLNMGLAKLEINEENKALIDAFMVQLAELDKEYGRLNGEIANNGPNSETIQALINNLQLRLDLLFKLKEKLDELKKERDEKFEKIQA